MDDGLINYWSFTNNVQDSVGTAHLFNGVNANLTYDRFNRSNSALDLKNGYYQAPNGVYFNGPFSITAWFYYRSVQYGSSLMDFGINTGRQNVFITLFNGNTPTPYVRINNNGSISQCGNTPFQFFNWTHIASTYDGNSLKLYMNGISVCQTTSGWPMNITRISNYIGKSYYGSNAYANATFDEIRFYNRALNQSEIRELMSIDL